MSTNWYAIEGVITVAKIKEVNEKLNAERALEENTHPITFKHDLLSDTHWLERVDVRGTHHALQVIDFNGQNFRLMKRWGMNGDNGTGEAILRPLVKLGTITIVSEYDERSPEGQAQLAIRKRLKEQTAEMQSLLNATKAEKADHNKLLKSTKEDRIKAGITKH